MISEAKKKALRLFSEGRELYKKMDFAGALERFTAACLADPTDQPSEVFKARCEVYVKNPPPEGWDGVFEMKTK